MLLTAISLINNTGVLSNKHNTPLIDCINVINIGFLSINKLGTRMFGNLDVSLKINNFYIA